VTLVALIACFYLMALRSRRGIPLISLGDEIGQLNDHSYKYHAGRAKDQRWVGRPMRPDALYDQRTDPTTTTGQKYSMV
jgi:amylosucrase